MLTLPIACCVVVLAAPPNRTADAPPEALLRAFGGVTAAYLYETHQKIGLLADSRPKKLYAPEVFDRELQTTLNMLKIVDQQMGDVLKAPLSDSDLKAVRTIRRIIARQVQSAEALQAYWKSNDTDDLNAYKKNRDEGWADLKKFLGKKDEEVKPRPQED